jgi:hypothetical protein
VKINQLISEGITFAEMGLARKKGAHFIFWWIKYLSGKKIGSAVTQKYNDIGVGQYMIDE